MAREINYPKIRLLVTGLTVAVLLMFALSIAYAADQKNGVYETDVIWPVPDTGQTKCYDVEGYNLAVKYKEISCPSQGKSPYGQDANYIVNPMFYTKFDTMGNALLDSATSWAMVKDNVTGLMWEAKTKKDGIKNYNDPHDADNTYTWYDTIASTNGGYAGTPGNGTDTEDFINALNSANYGGYSDWRMPTVKELAFIFDYSTPYPGPTISTDFFPNTISSFYWAGTTSSYNKYLAWGIYFNYYDGGHDYSLFKYASHYVRAVRGGQEGSLNNFIDNGDGTVTDSTTGLVWQKKTGTKTDWESAISYCENLETGGYTDWRLPTVKELRTIVDYSRHYPVIDPDYFPDTSPGFYWTSTTYSYNSSLAWGIHFDYGHGKRNKKGYNNYYVRAVRGGNPYQSTYDLLQWGYRGNDTFYCVDIFDADWNMLYQAAVCGEGLHGYSPRKLNLEPGTYHWRVWSDSALNYHAKQEGFEGEFIVPGVQPETPYQSTYDLVRWGKRGNDTFYCIDICDENWNVYAGLRAIKCGDGLYSWSPGNFVDDVTRFLGTRSSALSGFKFNWRVWSKGGYGGDGFEGSVTCP
ncbi:MAG: DUF1566 domain-containing protein [Desulfamplus sp.]|nr:DUF1566 domain-containing protein [Desulfamplus sp.]